MPKTVLIAGGAGFIGSNLCRRLLKDGCRVICVDNFYTGRRSNIDKLNENKFFSFLEHDIRERIDLKNETIDQIYNLACPASPPHYQRDPIMTLETNVLGMRQLLQLAEAHGARILQASTSEVYGDPEVHPQPEAYWGRVNPLGERSCYDEGKRCAETMCQEYNNHRGVDTRIIRIFNTYGPYMDPADGRVVSNFIVQALEGRDLTLYGDGSQTRSFQYIDDLIEGMVRLMNQDKTAGPINIGNPNEFTIKQLASAVLAAIPGSGSKLVYHDLPSDDPKQRKPDITNAKQFLDWSPGVELEEGLLKTIEYFREEITKP